MTTASPTGPPRPQDQGPGVSHYAPPLAGPPAVAIGEDAVRQLIAYAMADGGDSNAGAIMTVKREIEALTLNRSVDPAAHQRAGAVNERGLHALRDGNMAEAVQAFQAARQTLQLPLEQASKG